MSGLSDAALRHLREVSDQPDLSGTPYEVVETLGRGGMGTVYLAHDSRLDREVALKVVQLPEGTGDLDRLLLEARVLARLEHPGIVPVHDAGHLPGGQAFYAMKHVRGYGLDEYARTVPLPERLRAFERICEAVAFAHAHGVIHRDLKPENVMVGPFGEVLVMDWGVAKVRPEAQELRSGSSLDSAPYPSRQALTPPAPLSQPPPQPPGERGAGRFLGHSTAHGTILGTPGYMAPQTLNRTSRRNTRMNKPLFGLILGGILGAFDGLSALISAPQTKPEIIGIVVGSTIKGIIAGVLIGYFARKVKSLPLGILFGLAVGAALAYGVVLMGNPYFWQIMLPGSAVGVIVGYATQRHQEAPRVPRAAS
jgi:serine/threonine protein kinase